MAIWHVAYDADVATIAESARPPERTSERIVDLEPERKKERAIAVIGAHAIVLVIDERPEDDLGDFMSAGGELIENEVLARRRRLALVGELLHIVQRARNQDVICDPSPVESVGRWRWARLARGRRGGGRHGSNLAGRNPA